MECQQSLGYVKDTGTVLGRGVFASRAICSGEVVELCPVVLLTTKSSDLPTEIRRIIFNWVKLAKMEGTRAIALGYGSLYNHDNPANVRYEACGDGLFLRFIAVVDIEKDEELTINYNALGGAPVADHDTWFEKAGIEVFQRKS